MEPSPCNYKSMTSFIAKLPPLIPVDEEPQSEPMSEPSRAQAEADNNWTVYSANVLRGNLEGEVPLSDDDPRANFGWRANLYALQQRGNNPTPWMSSTEQQPMFSSGWGQGDQSNEEYAGLSSFPLEFDCIISRVFFHFKSPLYL